MHYQFAILTSCKINKAVAVNLPVSYTTLIYILKNYFGIPFYNIQYIIFTLYFYPTGYPIKVFEDVTSVSKKNVFVFCWLHFVSITGGQNGNETIFHPHVSYFASYFLLGLCNSKLLNSERVWF